MAPFRPRAAGFTLIELLIVVAIIAILAAIAVPNFLAAQMRAKHSRALNDLRTMRTAIEAYVVDHNRPPRHSWGCTYDDHYGEPLHEIYGTLVPAPSVTINGAYSDKGRGGSVTTPIAYLSTVPVDPFVVKNYQGYQAEQGADLYRYWSSHTLRDLVASQPCPSRPGYVWATPGPTNVASIRYWAGEYILLSVGPKGSDGMVQDSLSTNSTYLFLQYDPTNGIQSVGSIFVTQKHSAPTWLPHDALKWWPTFATD